MPTNGINNYYCLVIHYERDVSESVRVIGPFRTTGLAVDEAVNHWGAMRPEPTKRGNPIVFGKLYNVKHNSDHVLQWEVTAVEIPRGRHGWES